MDDTDLRNVRLHPFTHGQFLLSVFLMLNASSCFFYGTLQAIAPPSSHQPSHFFWSFVRLWIWGEITSSLPRPICFQQKKEYSRFPSFIMSFDPKFRLKRKKFVNIWHVTVTAPSHLMAASRPLLSSFHYVLKKVINYLLLFLYSLVLLTYMNCFLFKVFQTTRSPLMTVILHFDTAYMLRVSSLHPAFTFSLKSFPRLLVFVCIKSMSVMLKCTSKSTAAAVKVDTVEE